MSDLDPESPADDIGGPNHRSSENVFQALARMESFVSAQTDKPSALIDATLESVEEKLNSLESTLYACRDSLKGDFAAMVKAIETRDLSTKRLLDANLRDIIKTSEQKAEDLIAAREELRYIFSSLGWANITSHEAVVMISGLRADLKEARDALAAVKKSTSWQLTAPIRGMAVLWRSIRSPRQRHLKLPQDP